MCSIHRLFSKYHSGACYIHIYYTDIDPETTKNNRHPLFIHVIIRLIETFVPVMLHVFDSHREEVRAQCLHPPVHHGLPLIITSYLKCSFRYGKQWAQGSGCLVDGELVWGKFMMAISDTKGIHQLQFLDHQTTVNADCYCTTLQ
jgi:hypothetical protein